MNNSINKTMDSVEVVEMASRLKLAENDLWNIYFETGTSYVDALERRARRKRIFDALFQPMLKNAEFGERSFADVMSTIRLSPVFWFWWSVQFWNVCHYTQPKDISDLINNLFDVDDLIPHFILKQIFYGRQEPKRQAGASTTPGTEVTNTGATPHEARTGIKSRV